MIWPILLDPLIWSFLILLLDQPDHIHSEVSDDDAISYLSKFGYIPSPSTPPNGTFASPEVTTGKQVSLVDAITMLQEFAGLNVTGELDEITLQLIGKPRCGVLDIKSNYQLHGSKWEKERITYRVTKYSSKISRSQVNRDVWKAFSYWSSAANLQFDEITTGPVDIEISFHSYAHGDGDAFDGPGGTLAHAYFPRWGGDVHMDESEAWTADSYKGTSFLMTLTHEIGHSLGLEHSRIHGAVMAPFYRGYDPNFKLHSDDIRGVQALYGAAVGTTTRRPNTPGTSPGIVFPTVSPGGIPAFKCPDLSTNTQGRTVLDRIDGITSWAACSAKCGADRRCRYWTWHHSGAGDYAFRCVIMSDTESKVSDENAISGTKHCICPMMATNLQNREGVIQAGTKSSWSECGKSCRSRGGECNYWIWHPPVGDFYDNRCVLMAGYSNKASDSRTIAGSDNCV